MAALITETWPDWTNKKLAEFTSASFLSFIAMCLVTGDEWPVDNQHPLI